MLKQIRKIKLPLLLGLACLGLFLISSKTVLAANPATMNFQGKVVNASDSTNVNSGTSNYSIVFRIYDTANPTIGSSCSSDAHCKWEETQSSVPVTNGVFQVELGSVCPLTSGSCNNASGGPINWASSTSLYLTMKFGSDTSGTCNSVSSNGFMCPALHITSVPFAFQADNAANSSQLGGINAANYVQLATGNLQADNTTNNSIAVNKTGASGNILLLESNGKTALTVNNAGAVVLGQAGASGLAGSLTFDNATDASTASISFTGNSTASYTYLLPTASVGNGLCLESGTVSSGNVPLQFNSCTAGTYTTIQNSGSSLTQRSTLNFTGNSVSCVDNSGSSRTDCTVAPTLQNAYDNSGSSATVLTSSSTKNIVFQSGSGFNSTSAFQVQNSVGSPALSIDTTSLNNLISNSSFENASVTGWTASGTGASITTTNSQHYIGTYALDFTTGTAIGNEVQYNVASSLSTSKTYTLSFYAKTTTAFSTLSASYSPDGTAANETDCAVFNPSRSVSTTGWTRYYCTINTSSVSPTSSGYIAIKQSDASNRHLYIDAVQLEAGSTITQGLVGETGFESSLVNWTAITGAGGSGNTAVQSSADHYNGSNDLLITDATTPAAGTGAKYTTANTNPTQLATITGYTLSFWAKASGSNFSTLIAGYARDGSTQTNCSLNTNTVVTTGWTYYYCSFATDSTLPAASAYIYIEHSGTASTTWKVDNVQLTNTSTIVAGSSFKETGIALNGVINSPIVLENQADSTTALQLQNASGSSLMLADTLNSRIQFGTNGTATGQVYIAGMTPTFVATNADSNMTGPHFVYVQGRYAYIASYNTSKLVVYDVSNPAAPTYVGKNSDSNLSNPTGVVVQGRYAYVISIIGNKLSIYDISNPAAPTFVASNSDSNLNGPQSIYVQGRYAYVASYNNSKLAVYDISNPAAPTFVASNSDSNLSNPGGVYVQGRYAYVASYTNSKLAVYDISNPAAPTFVASNSDSNLNNPQAIFVQGRYAYLTNYTNNKLSIYDISNPAAPTFVASNSDSNLNNPFGVYVQGRYAYVISTGNAKLAVYDVSNPAAPTFVGRNSDSNLSNPGEIYVQGRYAYVTSVSNNKLAVYDLGGAYTQQLDAGGTETGTLQVDTNAQIAGDANIQGGLSVGQSLQVDGNLGVSSQVLFQNLANSASAFQVQNSNGSNLFSVDTQNNSVTVASPTNSSNAFQIKNASNIQEINIDSTGNNQNNLVSNPSIESAANIGNAGDWQKRSGSETALQQTSSQYYSSLNSLMVTTSAAAGDGVKQNITLTNGTTYTINFYAKLDSSATTFASSQGLEAGYSYNGTDITTLVSQALIPNSSGWTRYSWTFLQNQTNSGTPYIFIKQTDANARTFYLDAVTLQADANADGNYREGKITTNAIFASPIILQTTNNSSTALSVQNANGAAVFNLDTTTTNLVSNPGLEVNDIGWAAENTATISRYTGLANTGSASLKIVPAAIGDGAKYAPGVVWLAKNTQYSVSFYVDGCGSNNTFDFGYRLSASDSENAVLSTQAAPGGGWTRYSTTFTTNNSFTPDSTDYIYFKTDTSFACGGPGNLLIDDVDVEKASNVTGTGAGAISLSGAIKSPVYLQSYSNSNAAFLIQNATGTVLFTGDTLNSQVLLGQSGSLSGKLVFANSGSGSHTISLSVSSTDPGSNLTFQLPNALPGASNYCVVSSNLGILSFLPCGAGSTATVTLAPEFVGAVMTGVGGSNTGTMTSDYCAGTSRFPSGVNTSICTNATDEHNYYSWTSTGANNYDVFFRWSVPNDFASFPSSNNSFYGWKTGTAAGDDVKLNVYNSSSTACASQSMTNTSGSWQTTSINMSGCAPSPGTALTIDVHLSVSTSGNFARIGEITLQYNRN